MSLTIDHHTKRLSFLRQQREPVEQMAKDIKNYISPFSADFNVENRDKDNEDKDDIYDNAALMARRIHAAGMQSGASSPTQAWFEFETEDTEAMKNKNIDSWLDHAAKVCRKTLAQSNFYQVNLNGYDENATYGTAASLMFADIKNVVHFYPKTFGEYFIASDQRGVVDTLYSEFQMTISQIVQEFGVGNLSETARALYIDKKYDSWVTIVHAIEPNLKRNITRNDNRNMRWVSNYYEKSTTQEKFLRRSGFETFPALTPRWDVRGRQTYGSECPGMVALGDTKQLQDDMWRKAMVLDYKTNPPLQIPEDMKNSHNTLPRGKTYYNQTVPHGGIRTAFEVNLPMSELLEDIQDIRLRIDKAYFVDVFQMMIQDQRRQPATAREVDEKHLEKMLMLGPTVERNQNDELGPVVRMTFGENLRVGNFRKPPPEMEGQLVNIKYVGVLAQAQRAVGLTSVDRFVGMITGVGQSKPEIMDKLNTDQLADEYSNRLGVSPDLVVSNADVALIREQRARIQQDAMAAQQANLGADTAKKLSETPTDGDTALSEASNQFVDAA